MLANGKYKYIEFGILVLVVIFVLKFAGVSFSNNSAERLDEEATINVYMSNGKLGSNSDCSVVFPVKRVVPNAENLGPSAVGALLQGVSLLEKSAGYSTAINQGAMLQKFEVEDGVAYVDFNKVFSEVAGSCRVLAIRSQVEKTLLNVPGIYEVVISVDGQTEGILEP